MIILRTRHFSLSNRKMIDNVVENLDKMKVEDYELTERIPKDVISITIDDNGLIKVYIPRDYEYSQYDIDDYIRSLQAHYRTNTFLDRNLYVMKVSGPLKPREIAMLVKFIADENDFCSIVE